MIVRVTITPSAVADLNAIVEWIEDRAGRTVADGYDARIRRAIAGLEDFPHRGTDRPDLGEGLRSITFERRILIVYRVDGERVDVRRVVHGSRDVGGLRFG